MSVELNLAGINNLGSLLQRLPLGENARSIAMRLGVWNTRTHENAAHRPAPYPTDFSQLTEQQVSEKLAFWNSELVRVYEVAGLLEGQRKYLELQAKKARAQARSEFRRAYEQQVADAEPGVKVAKPTAGELNDRAEEHAEVIEADTTLVMLDVVLASVQAYKEGCLAAVAGISREITFRTAQYGARLS